MRDLLVLKQTGTVKEYRNQFNQLVYQVRLYEGGLSETFLVTQFILGLKDEIKAAVEIQLPATVHAATEYALVQETLIERGKAPMQVNCAHRPLAVRNAYQKSEQGQKQFTAEDVWKSRQLKEFRRANGLCYSCGENIHQGTFVQTKKGGKLRQLKPKKRV